RRGVDPRAGAPRVPVAAEPSEDAGARDGHAADRQAGAQLRRIPVDPLPKDSVADAVPGTAADAMLELGRRVLAAQPFSVLLGARLLAFGSSGVELEVPITDVLRQQNGFAHGGVVSYLADNALTYAGG